MIKLIEKGRIHFIRILYFIRKQEMYNIPFFGERRAKNLLLKLLITILYIKNNYPHSETNISIITKPFSF